VCFRATSYIDYAIKADDGILAETEAGEARDHAIITLHSSGAIHGHLADGRIKLFRRKDVRCRSRDSRVNRRR